MKIALFTTFATLGMLLLLVTINDQATQLSERYELQSANSSQNKTENGYRWQAATFRGLKIGQATIDEVLSILGKPKWIGPEADQDQSKPNPTLYYSFEGGGEFPGKVAVLVDSKSKKVMQIRNIPEKLSKEEAIRHFGTDYVISKYEFCPDIDATTAPVYPDPNGPLVRIEYRKRGIVLDLDDDKTIGEIAYVKDIQVLASKEDCKKTQKKR